VDQKETGRVFESLSKGRWVHEVENPTEVGSWQLRSP